MISKRLKAISNMVDEASYLIDVGCDHALLDIYLVKYKKCKAIASDINEKPLEKASENIKNNKLEDKIKISLADGISKMPESVDTIIISGMGTDNILKILKDNQKIENIKHIIISTQNKYEKLRYEMMKKGFCINNEDFIKDKNKYYLIIDFIKKEVVYTKKELIYGPILLNSKTIDYKEYLKNEIDKLNNINKNLKFKNILLKIKNKRKIREIKNIL